MSASTFSFIGWVVFMVAMLGGLMIAARRGRHRSQETEDVASKALPEIGLIAERTHSQKFGRAPTGMPGTERSQRVSWYPPTKNQKHG